MTEDAELRRFAADKSNGICGENHLAQLSPNARRLGSRALPEQVFACLAEYDGAVFLDSCGGNFGSLSKWSFLSAAPARTISLESGQIIERSCNGEVLSSDGAATPFSALRQFARQFGEVPAFDRVAPLHSGLIGYLSYEIGSYLEQLPEVEGPALDHPRMWFGYYPQMLGFRHGDSSWWLLGRQQAELDLESELKRAESSKSRVRQEPPNVKKVTFTPDRDQYLDGVNFLLERIRAGDIYQANLTRQVEIQTDGIDPVALYLRLRTTNAAPFAAAIKVGAGDNWVLSTSPERFLKLGGSTVEVRPIKGTAPRSDNIDEDIRLMQGLAGSEKDSAELAMIVDVLRNDIGRVCSYGSVRMIEHKALESYARVHHLVSTITGELHPQYDTFDLLAATFPGGSITGAPKIKAMELLSELEVRARGISTGAIGYVDGNGDADFNVAIRTVVVRGDRACFGVGGGIVADSICEEERLETLHKASAIFDGFGIQTPDC